MNRSCEALAPLVMAYHDGELGGRDAWRVRWHLRSCAVCAAQYRSLAKTDQLLAVASPLTPRNRVVAVTPTNALVGGLTVTLAGLVALASVNTPRPISPQVSPTSNPALQTALSTGATPAKLTASTSSVAVVENVAVVTKSKRRRRVANRTHRRTKPLVLPLVAEELTVVATQQSIPAPVTVVTRDTDDDGGTIVISCTTPASYVAASDRQPKKELL